MIIHTFRCTTVRLIEMFDQENVRAGVWLIDEDSSRPAFEANISDGDYQTIKHFMEEHNYNVPFVFRKFPNPSVYTTDLDVLAHLKLQFG